MGCDGVTVDLGSAIDGLLEGALGNANLGNIRHAQTPAECAAAGGVVRRVGPFASPEQRAQGFICAVPGAVAPRESSYSRPAKSYHGLGEGLASVAIRPVPFMLGAVMAPGVIGFGSRILADARTLGISPVISRGAFFAGTAVSAFIWGHPFLWGAFIGQLGPTMDSLAETLVNVVMPSQIPVVSLAPRSEMAESLWAQQADLSQVSDEDIEEMKSLKAALGTGNGNGNGKAPSPPTNGNGMSDRMDLSAARLDLGTPAASRVPTSFT